MTLKTPFSLAAVFLFAISTISSSALDQDGDGISDVYAAVYPDPAGVTLDAAVDFDGDGQITGNEAYAGTDWRDPSSVFHVNLVSGSGGLFLEWFGVLGKRYQPLSNPDLFEKWAPVGSVQLGPSANLSVPVSKGDADKYFWRIRILPDLDADGDLLNKYEEGLLGTSDSSSDTDGDGNSDAQEFVQGTDPTSNLSYFLPQIVKTGGDGQATAAAVVASTPLSVKVTGTGGVLLPHVPVTFSVLSGGGSLTPAVDDPTALTTTLSYTGLSGEAAIYYRQPASALVSSQIQALVGAGSQTATVTFTVQTTSAPANDLFANAMAISGASSSITQSNAGATVEAGEPEHAGVPAGATVWFDWTAPSTGDFQFVTSGSDIDTVLGIYTGSSVFSLTTVASSDDEEAIVPRVFSGRVAFRATSGQHYKIAVAGYKARTGQFSLAWQSSTGPTNDMFASASMISGNSGTTTGSNVGATLEGGEPQHDNQAQSGSVWYSYTAAKTGTLEISTAGSNFHTVLAVYTGSSVSGLTAMASNTNEAPGITTSKISFPITQGVTYRVAVSGTVEARGTISLGWTLQIDNDNFDDARAIVGTSGQVFSPNSDATKETGEPNHAGQSGGASKWFSWQAPTTDTVQIDTIGSDFDTILGVYTGFAVGSLTTVASDDDSGGNYTSSIQFPAVAGTTYLIAVDGYNGSKGNIVLNWAQPPPLSLLRTAATSSLAKGKAGAKLATALPAPTPPETGAQKDQRLYGTKRAKFAAMSAEEECDEGPAEANKGEAVYIDENGGEQTSRAVYVAFGPPKSGSTTPETCPQTVTVQHKIVTTNTPRARDLPGKLTLTFKSGDPDVVEIKNNGSTYTLGTPISVLETGHSGCGVHDWHLGTEDFTFEGKKKGTVVLEAAVDPDPDDGGDGQPTKKLEITVTVFELKLKFDPPTNSDYGISAKAESGFPDFEAANTKEKIAVETDPANIAADVELKVDSFDPSVNPSYVPTDKGTIMQKSPTEWEYVSYEEKKSEMKPAPKKVVIKASVNDSKFCLEYKLLVRPVFTWLVGLHQHGPGQKPHSRQTADYEAAWKYVRWKYDIDTSNLSSISYGGPSPGGGALAATDMRSNSGPRSMVIYESAFAGSENALASVLGHENVHGGQSMNFYLRSFMGQWTGDFNSKIEYPGYKWQLDNAAKCGLSPDEIYPIKVQADRTKRGENASD